MTRHAIIGFASVVATAAGSIAAATADHPLDGRAPTTAELTPSVEAAFVRGGYGPRGAGGARGAGRAGRAPPGAAARQVTAHRARAIRNQIFRSGPRADPDA